MRIETRPIQTGMKHEVPPPFKIGISPNKPDRSTEPKNIDFEPTTIVGIDGKLGQVLQIILDPKNQNPNLLEREIISLYPNPSQSSPRRRFKAMVHSLKRKLEKQGFTIISTEPEGRQQGGTWKIMRKEGLTITAQYEKPARLDKPPSSDKRKPKAVLVFDFKKDVDTKLTKTDKKGVPGTSQFTLPDGQVVKLPPTLIRALEMLSLARREERDISTEDLLGWSGSDYGPIARGAFSNALSKCRPALKEKGWEIQNVGYNGEKRSKSNKGTWILQKIKNPHTKTFSPQPPQTEPAISPKESQLGPQGTIVPKPTSQEAPQNLPVFEIIRSVNFSQSRIIKLILTAREQNRDVTEKEWQSLYPNKTSKEAWYTVVGFFSSIRKKIRYLGWTIEIVDSKPGYEGKTGKPVFKRIGEETLLEELLSPLNKPPLSHKRKPRTVPVFDAGKTPIKPVELKIPPVTNKLPKDNERADLDKPTLDLIEEIIMPSIQNETARAMLGLIIEAARKNETPKKADLEKLLEKEGIKDRKTIWELIHQRSGMIRPALRELGLNIEPIDGDIATGAGGPSTISFRLMKIKPPNSKLLFSIEEIEASSVQIEPEQQGKEKATSGIQKEDSPELEALKIDLTLSILSILLNNGLDNLERNPEDLLVSIAKGERSLRSIVGRKDKPGYVNFILNSIEETAGRLISETKTLIEEKAAKSKDEEKGDKEILTSKEQQIVDILYELMQKRMGMGIKIIDEIKKAISEHFSPRHQAKPIEDAALIFAAENDTTPLSLPNGQTIELGGKSRKIFEVVIKAQENDGEVSDEDLLKIDPKNSPKKAWRYMSKRLWYLNKKLAEKGWTIKNEGSRPGAEIGKRGRLVLRKIENSDGQRKTSAEEHFPPDSTSVREL